MDRAALRLIVRGRVQGVGYRQWACGEARRLGLEGWVRNRLDGTAELMAAGAPDALKQFVQACWRGPFAAQVTAIEQSSEPAGAFDGFRERPTG